MENMNRIRKARGLSQAELADRVGCNQSTISKMEKGDLGVTLELVQRVAVALETTPVFLFGLPLNQQRALNALDQIDAAHVDAALVVLEAMAER